MMSKNMTKKEAKAATNAFKEVAREVKKEVKATRSVAAKANLTATVLRNAKNNTNHPQQAKAAHKAKKDPVFLRYFNLLINPDLAELVGVPDGFPVPTAVSRSIQTIDVIANYDETSVANGDGGRFSYHIGPNLGKGCTTLSGYISVPNTYVNTASDPLVTELVKTTTLGAKVAGMKPNVVWDPGFVFDPALSAAKDTPKPVSQPKSELVDLRKTAYAKIGKPRGMVRHRLEADLAAGTFEFWYDPLCDDLGGGVIGANINIGGIANLVRPVGMSVWFECDKPDLDNGGNVTACLLPSGVTTGQVIPLDWLDGPAANEWTGFGPLQNWENLAEVPGNYNGKMKDGTYTFWVPQRVQDMDMSPVQISDLYDFPTIMVSGQWTPNAGEVVSAASALVGRLRICTVYEYTSQSQVASLKYASCTPNPLERVKLLLHGTSTSMANGQHLAWIKKMVATAAGGVMGFLGGGPAGAVEGAIGGYALGKKWAS